MKLPRLIKVRAAIVASLGFGLHPLGAASPMDSVSVPDSKDKQTPVAGASRLTSEMEKMAKLHDYNFVNPEKQYTLPELVDLAQRHNLTTRTAWERAIQAAAQTGMTKAEFYPLLTVVSSYGGGYWHQDLTGAGKQTGLVVPVELNDKAGGPYTVFNAGVSLRYTLFDFGQRSALTNAAKRKQLAANLTFNATHQTVTFQVTQAYYTLETTRRLIEAAEISAASASDILAATQDKFEHGLVTEPNLLQARQAKAQGEFDLVNARSNWEVARLNLIKAIGAEPQCALKVAPANFASLGNQIQEPLDSFVQSALQKPDLLAKVAEAQAAQASLRAARAAPLPTVSLTAMQNYSQFETTIQGSGNVLSNVGLGFQNYGGFVKVEWPIFDGGLDSNKIKAAESSWREAKEAVLLARDKSVADVLGSYTSVKAALARRESAEALQTASKAAYDSLRASFDLGITPIQDVLAARTSLAQAMALRATADGAVAASLATLTYISGGF